MKHREIKRLANMTKIAKIIAGWSVFCLFFTFSLLIFLSPIQLKGGGFTGLAEAYDHPWDCGHDKEVNIQDPKQQENMPKEKCTTKNTDCPDGSNAPLSPSEFANPANGENPCSASPAFCKTGNYNRTEEDLIVPGNINLEMRRTYNSNDNMRSGLFGYSWNFTYGHKLRVVSGGEGDYALVLMANGLRFKFPKKPDGTYSSPDGRKETLVKNADGTYTMRRLYSTGYVLDHHFDAEGNLIDISDLSGNQIIVSYQDNCPVAVTNDSGDSLTFTKGPHGKIVQVADNHGRTIAYTYNSNGDLETVTDAGGNIYKYKYDTTHNLLSISDSKENAVVTVSYDNDSKVKSYSQGGETWTTVYVSDTKTEKKDSQGNKWTYTYNADGVITEVQDPLGNKATREYNPDGTVKSMADANGNTWSFTYDEHGNRASLTDPLGKVTQYTYDLRFDKVATVNDPLGRVTKYEYDDKGNRIKRVRDLGGPLESTTTYTYDDKGNMTSKTDPVGHITQYEHDANGNLTRVVDSMGNAITYTYDASGNKLSATNALGNTTTYTYDLKNNLTSVTDPVGNKATYGYDESGNKTTFTDQAGNTGKYEYDTFGKVIKKINPLGKVIQYSYNSIGKIASITDADNNTTLLTYDSAMRLEEITDALGNKIRYAYDKNGNISTRTDAKGAVTSYEHDALDRLVKKTDPLGQQTRYAYDTVGNVVSMTDAKGNVTQHQYDSRNRLIKAIDSLGNATTYTYDKNGNMLTWTDAKGGTTSYEYDALGCLVTKTDPLGHQTKYTHDAVGNVTSMTDAKGNVTQYQYDADNRGKKTINPLNGETTFTFDKNGNPLSITDAKGQTSSFSYDSLNRNVSMINPEGEKETYDYDNKSNLVKKTLNNGDTITNEYDKLGRLVKKTLSPGGVTTYIYDQAGKITSITNPYSSITFSYDQNNLLLSTHTAATDYQPESTISYTYDANGNRLSMTDPFGGVTNYTYDARDTLATLTAPDSKIPMSFAYDQNNRRISKVLPNGLTSSYSYDADDDLTSLTHRLGTATISGYGYEYDAMGNRTRITDPDGTHSYSYDKYNQLLQADHPNIPTESFTYDPVGNRISTASSSNWNYDTGNRLLDDGTFTYVYTNGCLTRKTNKSTGEVTTYTYNAEKQLVAITTPTSTISYYYDGLGRRICKEINSVKTYYLCDGEDILFALDNNSSIIARYTHGRGIDEPVQIDQNGVSYYYLADGLGNITRIVDHSGNVQQQYTYDSYGNIVSQTGTLANPYTFTAREYDPESGLYYYRARYYDARIGKFLQPDPIGFAGGDVNLCAYVWNNPVNWGDPWGLWVGVDDLVAIGGGAAIGAGASIIGQGIGSIFFGRDFDWGEVGMSALAGAVAGEATLYAGPIAGGAAAGFVHSVGNEIRNKGTCFKDYSLGRIALETGIGAGAGWIGSKLFPGTANTGVADDVVDDVSALPSKLYHYTDEAAAELIESSQLGLPGQTLYLTPEGGLTPIQAQIELALPAQNTGKALFEIDTTILDPQQISKIGRVVGNVFNRGGGGTEILYNGPIPLEAVTRIK